MYATIRLSASNQLGAAHTLDPRAANLFDKMYRNPEPNALAKLFQGVPRPLNCLHDVDPGEIGNRHAAGTQAIPLDAIHGTLDRSGDFDYDFRPLQHATEPRWRKVATAMLRGIDLPPVELIKVGQDYFVVDGHHRISVARALGYGYIDAVVEEWHLQN